VSLLEFVAGNDRSDPATAATARLWIADGRAAGVRRRAKLAGRLTVAGIEGDLADIELYYPEGAADWIAAHGPDVLVLEPDVLAKAVRERLHAVAEGAVR